MYRPSHGPPTTRRARHTLKRLASCALLLSLSLLLPSHLCAASPSSADIQFDVFLGYDGFVPEACWFPMVCEVKNDGPGFNGVVELSGGAYNPGETLQLRVELPTGTLKRFVLPVFSSTRGYTSWDVRLRDARGKVRAEQIGLHPRKQLARGAPLLGALSRTPGGAPAIKTVSSQSPEMQPATARLLPPIFPDNPIVLEGLSALYLNSERAVDLTKPQVLALIAYLNDGGHLIVAVEQPSDITSSPWLKNLVPCEVKDLQTIPRHPELQDWLRSATWPANSPAQTPSFRSPRGPWPPLIPSPDNLQQSAASSPFGDLPMDLDFEAAPLQVAVGQVREGTVEVAAGDKPLVVSAHFGRGKVTLLLFSPEREPLRSWKNLDTFWARVVDVPGALYVSKNYNPGGGWSSDGIFGAMIDTRQVHKLPVGWLLMLLLVYLVVIGPLDQFWLKRIGKPMLTWLTFPCYVVLFSLIIYFIGYKLRAGESEWNELHLVDVLPNGDLAGLRGRTYCSVYSPSNQRYALDAHQRFATLRGEFAGLWGGGSSSDNAAVVQNGDSFNAQIFVPVWTSQLYVSDWWQPAPAPLEVSLHNNAGQWQVAVDNHTERKLVNVQIVFQGRIAPLGDVPANESKTFTVARAQTRSLQNYVGEYGARFGEVVSSRQRALGASESGQLSDLPNCSVAASFLGQLGNPQMNFNFTASPGLDLSPVIEQGGAVLLAWAPDYSPVKPIYQFSPRRCQKNTLWRVSLWPE